MKRAIGLRLMAFVFVFLLSISLTPPHSTAQNINEVCPALVESALHMVAESCPSAARNEVCYGNRRVDASFADGVSFAFDAPGDYAPVGDLRTLNTSAASLDTVEGDWGVAVLYIQANLPDSLPGQVVRFLLLGDVQTHNLGHPNQPRIPDPCPGTTTEALNMRSGSGSQHNIVTSVQRGTALNFTGRSEDADWLYTHLAGQPGWMAADLVQLYDCDAADDLPLHDSTAADVYGPMQAFVFSTGLGTPLCEAMSASAIVINSPHGYTVAINANGVTITLSSTVILTSPPGGPLTITTLEGRALVNARGLRQSVPAGFATRVALAPANAATGYSSGPASGPTAPELIDPAAWQALEPALHAAFGLDIQVPEMTAWHNPNDFCDDPVNAGVCADPFFNVPYCGDAVCDADEDAATCARDCGVTASGLGGSIVGVCGNAICEAGESAQSCPADCFVMAAGGAAGVSGGAGGSVTGGGTTSSGPGTATPTPEPLGYCGDGICGAGEDYCSCIIDCREPVVSSQPCD